MQRFSSGLESKGDREASLQKMTGRLSREGTLVSVGLFPPFFQSTKSRTSLAAGWLRLCAPNAGGPGSLPGWATRSCMPQLRPDADTDTDTDTHTHTHTHTEFLLQQKVLSSCLTCAPSSIPSGLSFLIILPQPEHPSLLWARVSQGVRLPR